jgi:hypothetical protein
MIISLLRTSTHHLIDVQFVQWWRFIYDKSILQIATGRERSETGRFFIAIASERQFRTRHQEREVKLN